MRIRPDATGFSAEAKAAIERTSLEAKAKIDVDAGAADVKIEAVKAELGRVDGKTAHANINVDIGGALMKIGIVAAAMAALAGVGAAVGIGAVAVAGIGASVAGLSGIGGAVKALGDQTKNAGVQAGQAASNHLAMAAAMDRVRSAQASLANTIVTASEAERQATQKIVAAQRDLVTARRDAARQLRDLALQQQDMALSQRGALLAIRQAKENLDATLANPTSTNLQRAQAQLAYDEAKQHSKDLGVQAQDLAAKKLDADRKGVAGSDLVRAAQAKVAEATRAAANTQRQGALQIQQAQQSVVDAQRAVQAASISAGQAGAKSMDTLGQAMKNLSPVGVAFAVFLRGFIDGPLKQLRANVQEGLLPGLQKGLASLGPIIQSNLPAIRSFSTVLGQALGGLIEVAGKLAAPFLQLATVSLRALAPLKGVLDQFAVAFGRMVAQVTKDGSLQAAMDGLVKLFAALLSALPALLPPMIQLAAAILPLLAKVVVALLPGLSALITALGPIMVAALNMLIPVLAKLSDWLAKNQKVAALFALAVLALVSPAAAIVVGLGVLVNWLVRAYQHSESFRNVLRSIGQWITEHVLPPVRSLIHSMRDGVVSAFHSVADAIGDHRKELATLGHALKDVVEFVLKYVIPAIGVYLKTGYIVLGKAIAAVIDIIAWLIHAFGNVIHAGGNVIHALGNVGHAFANVGRAVKGAYNDVTHWFGNIVSFVAGLPGKIGRAASGMWDGIKTAFRAALNWIIDAWNNMDFTISVPQVHIPGTNLDIGGGSFTLGLPDIPHLATGGIVKATQSGTLAMLGEGGRNEAIVPLGPGGDMEDALYSAVSRALAGATLRLERRGTEVIARLANAGNLSLRGLA